ncbi:MAG: hypothetical protein IPM89_02540 [Candidatus Competibacteraceae bacterium]|nr:MAG: hypothetical protein IPM89_02540 [Candidatus Competibacteraceae bacterium]
MNSNIKQFEQEKYIFILMLTIIFTAVVIRAAWISDDAAITFRVVLNFTHGFGPVFNITERVQAYTHPLWFFVISFLYLIINNVFYATLFVSIILSVLSFVLVSKLSLSIEWAIIGLLVLIFSKSFIDFSTSGLENPLSYFLLILFIFAFKKQPKGEQSKRSGRYLFKLTLLFSLLYLNRPDLIILILPIFLLVFYRIENIKIALPAIVLGILPLALWTLFSLIYYGFPFPNTAYAKLGTGIDNYELVLQGVQYFFDSLRRDPLTLIVIFISLILGLKNRSALTFCLSLGIIFYCLYILKIGGDFMSGRFFSVLVITASIILVNLPKITISTCAILSVAIIIIGVSSPTSTLFINNNVKQELEPSGIVDEQGWYYKRNGLLSGDRYRFIDLPAWPKNDTTKIGKVEIIDVKVQCGGLGHQSLYDGPFVHFIDPCGLTDPLLARLPVGYNKNWRVGHYGRVIPTNYASSISSSRNLLEDVGLKNFYDKLNVITRSQIFSVERFMTILRMNLGQYSYLINKKVYRKEPVDQAINQDQISKIKPEGTAWDALGNYILSEKSQLDISFNTLVKNDFDSKLIDISLDNNDQYTLVFEKKSSPIGQIKVGPKKILSGGLARYDIKIPNYINEFDKIIIKPFYGDGKYSVGHLVLKSSSEL